MNKAARDELPGRLFVTGFHPESSVVAPMGAARRRGHDPFMNTKLLALGLALACSAGCAGPGRAAPQLSPAAVRLDLPLVRQDALYDCGLASIGALCQYWRVEIPQAERDGLARTAQAESGLAGSELCRALEHAGLETFLYQGSLDRSPTGIYTQVDAGRPPLVMLSSDGARHHYELVLGYDEPLGNLILLDPLKGEILVPAQLFARDWERCRRFTLLASPPAQTEANPQPIPGRTPTP